MSDTGKMKKLFKRCTSSIIEDPLSYPEGDLDSIAEQISLRLDALEKCSQESDDATMVSDRRVAKMKGILRRAYDLLGHALNVGQVSEGE